MSLRITEAIFFMNDFYLTDGDLIFALYIFFMLVYV